MPEGLIFFFESVSRYIFLIDLILNFNTAFYQSGRLVLERGEIAKEYLKKTFFQDFIIVVTFFLN